MREIFVCGLLLSSLLLCRGQEQAPTVVERGPHHRVWEKTVQMPGPGGKTRLVKRSYTEMAGGMHYQDADGKWLESSEEIELVNGQAVARRGQHKVTFAANINTPGSITIETPDHKLIKSQIFGLAYYDEATQKSVLVAELKDSIGELHAPNVVIYPDAFTDIRADIKYVYKRSGFAQDVVLKEAPPEPEKYGLSAKTSRLEVWSEITDAPLAQKTTSIIPGGQDWTSTKDETLDFGTLVFGRGKAFSAGQEKRGLSVGKAMMNVQGRQFLIEAVPYNRARPELDALPKAPMAALRKAEKLRLALKEQNGRFLPARQEAKLRNPEFQIGLEQVPATKGFVLDYESVIPTTDTVFKSGTTYLVSGPLVLYGVTTFEGNSVIKLTNANSAMLVIAAGLSNKTDNYRPVVVTSVHDDTIGEVINGSSGVPASYPFAMNIWPSGVTLKNFRFRFADQALTMDGDNLKLTDCQFVKCPWALYFNDTYNCWIENTLFYASDRLAAGNGFNIGGQHLTVHECATMGEAYTDSGFFDLTNSLLVAVTNIGDWNVDLVTNQVGIISSAAGVFQTVGGARHYLAPGSPYRNVGTTNISASLRESFQQKTTFPPVVFSNSVISVSNTFNPQVPRDADLPDLGFHYPVLDLAFGGVDGNVDITFGPDTAVGWFRTSADWYHAGHGLHMADQKVLTFDGRATAPNYWVRCSTVQEGETGFWDGGYGPGGITGWADQNLEDVTLSPVVRANYTRFSAFGGENHFRDDNGYLIVRANHSEFYGAGTAGYVISCYFTNCLFEGVNGGQVAGLPGNEVYLRNCTWRNGRLDIARVWTSPIPISIRDSAFENTVFDTSGDIYSGNSAYTDYDYNAFLSGASRPNTGSTHDLVVSSFNWQSGWLGDYYLPTTSSLINAGSLSSAGLAGLYHYTTLTNQVKETNTVVDIGFHRVASELINGKPTPLDSDNDGIPDYLEDANGNGTTDTGERNWQTPNTSTNNLGLIIFTPLK